MLEAVKSNAERSLAGVSQLQSQLTFRFSVLSKLLDRQMAAIAAAHSLSLVEYRALVTCQAFGELSAADLARYTGYDKGVLSRAVTGLSQRGLLAVRPDPDHGLRKILSVTEQGAASIDAVRPAVDARRKNLSAQLTGNEEEVFLRVVEKLAAHVERDLAQR